METYEYDVVVVGSGAAGLSAAIAASDSGARVALLEASEKFGGTTAVSAGMMWIPCTDEAEEAGIDDDADAVRQHLRHVGGESVPQELIDAFVDLSPKVLRYLQARTPLSVGLVANYPDYHPEAPGGRGRGRVLDPEPFDTSSLGERAGALRRSPIYSPITARERDGWSRLENRWDMELIEARRQSGAVTLGCALAGSLLKGCIDRDVTLRTASRVRRFHHSDDGRVAVTAVGPDGEAKYWARGVVLATGGFEWNGELNDTFLRGPLTGPASPPTGRGDGLNIAIAAGAKLRNMSEAWWFPTVHFQEEFEGRPLYRMLIAERNMPGSIIVNLDGRRFVNEAANYSDMAKSMHEFDATSYRYRNVPAYLIFDAMFRSRYSVFGVDPSQPDSDLPAGILVKDTLDQLAEALGIDADGLMATVEQFNSYAAQGHDPDFHRGTSLFDQHEGDSENTPNPNLGPLTTGPFYATQVHPGGLGTKGGPATDASGRVLDTDGEPIPGLFSAGNVSAGLGGIGYVGAGATLGPALTFGFAAGASAAGGPDSVDKLLVD